MRMLRVVVADNNPDYGSKLCRYLNESSVLTIVGEAYDGEEALRLVVETKPDLLILELYMMKLMSFEVLERIPADAMPRWIILIGTATEDFKFVQWGLARGAQRYVSKWYPRLILEALRDLLREYKAGLSS
jgi:DNA-binding NarL/FixJ family response regulator